MKTLLVADASPLIALAHLELLTELSAIADQILVPETVFGEATAAGKPGAEAVLRFERSGGLRRVPDPVADELPVILDAGEAAAIRLARQLDALLLIDDKAGRDCARRLGIVHIGIAGLLAVLKRKGRLPVVKPLLESLLAQGYFLSSSVVKQALVLAGE